MTFKLNHIEPREELSNIVRSFFELSYSAEQKRADYLLPSGRIAFFHIRSDEEFQVEFESTERHSLVRTGYYLAYIDCAAKYVHPKIDVVAASLYPFFLGLIFRIKPRDILNTFTKLEDVIDLEKSGLSIDTEGLSAGQLVSNMQDFIVSRLDNNPMREDVLLIYNKIVTAKAYTITVGELSEWMGYSERHISNIFQEYIGLSPKRFIQLIRFNESIKMIDDLEKFPKLSDVAYEMGYHDQAHFTRDFRRFCGMTPKAIRSETNSAAYLFRKGKKD